MRERLDHVIFHGRDADAQFLVNLSIAEFIDTMEEKDTSGLVGQAVDRRFIEFEEVSDLDSPLLLGRARSIAFLFKRKDDDIVAGAPPGAVDQEIASDALQKRGGVRQTPRLSAADGAQEYLLNKIGSRVLAGAAPEILEQSRPLGDEGVFETGITWGFAFERRPEHGDGAVMAAGRDR